jgi:hypothetical protein
MVYLSRDTKVIPGTPNRETKVIPAILELEY